MIFISKLIFGSKRGKGSGIHIYATPKIAYSSPFIKNPETNLNSIYKIKV